MSESKPKPGKILNMFLKSMSKTQTKPDTKENISLKKELYLFQVINIKSAKNSCIISKCFLKINNGFGVLVATETKLYLIPISFQPGYVQLVHFKLTLFDLGHQRSMKSGCKV